MAENIMVGQEGMLMEQFLAKIYGYWKWQSKQTGNDRYQQMYHYDQSIYKFVGWWVDELPQGKEPGITG